jgi:hypothetical protein
MEQEKKLFAVSDEDGKEYSFSSISEINQQLDLQPKKDEVESIDNFGEIKEDKSLKYESRSS